MSAIHCLSSDELRDFVLGQTDDARSEEILNHLSECPACEDTVASLDDTADSLVASVRQAVEQGDAAGSPADEAADPLAAALANVRDRFAPSVAAPPLDVSLSRIIERVRDYELVDELGSGGMGTVYKAVHTKLDRTVALKLLPARRLRDQAAVARFEREMKAIGRLDHPAIVRATDAGEVDGTHFLAMDFVDGIDLGKLVRLTGPLDAASACELIRQAAIGLQYAHEQGLIHRDVKPSNLMVERSSRGPRVQSSETASSGDPLSGSGLSTLDSQLSTVRILDLGLALFGSSSEAVDELTTVGQLMGTLDYMAPEQADNSHAVDARADVYSLGATLFKLLAGAAPYETAERCSPLQKMKALATTDPPPIAFRCDGLPDGLAAIVDRMLLHDPDERFQSAAEVAEALAPFCDGAAIGSLVERAVQLAELQREARDRQLQSSHLAPRDEPLAVSASNNLSPAHAVLTSDGSRHSGNAQPAQQNGSSRGARWLLWTALTAIALLAGITIWIQTDTGTLKIECADEHVPIEIRNSSGNVVKSETLSIGQNEIVIHSGSYEIVLPKDYDELKVENGKYELTRGGEWIARVTKQPAGSDQAGGVATPLGPGGSTPPAVGPDQFEWRDVDVPLDRQVAAVRSFDLQDLVDIYVDRVPRGESDSQRVRELVAERAEVRTITASAFQVKLTVRVTPDEEFNLRLAGKVGSFSAVLRAPGAGPLEDSSIKRFDPQVAITQIEADAAKAAQGNAGLNPASTETRVPERSKPAAKNVWPLGPNLPGMPAPKPSGSLVFSGRTFEQWQQSVLTERNPEELKNAVMALCILGRQNRDREAAETVLKVTDAYPCEINNSPEGELVAAAIRYLRTLDADSIVPAIVEALKDRGINTRRVIVEHLAAGVMYGGGFGGVAGGGGAIPNTGKAEPLQSRLVNSAEYLKTLVELFAKFGHEDPETATLRLVAFRQIEAFLNNAALQAQIDALLEHIYENATTTIHPVNRGSYVSKAILHLSRRSPRPELAAYFLDNLERTYSNAPPEGSAAWLPSYSSDWYGMWLLGDKAEAESERIVKLLTAKLPGTYHPSPVQATTVPTTVAGWGDTNSPRQWVTRKVLALDLLATIGPGAKSAIPAVIDEIEALTGERPVDDGEYGYEANDPQTFFVQYEAPFSHLVTGSSSTFGGLGSGGVPGTGGGFFSVSDVGPQVRNREPITMPEPWLRLNAALRALKSLTGKTPRFTTLQLGVKQPAAAAPGSTPGAAIAGGSDAGGGYSELSPRAGGLPTYGGDGLEEVGSSGSGMYGGEPVDDAWRPRRVSYRGKRFAEWAAETLAFQPSTKLNEVRWAIEVLGANEKTEAVATAAARVFEAAMSQRGEITDIDRRVIHNSFRHCWQSNDGPARGKLLQAIFGGTPERTALVLTEIVAPSLDLTKPQPTVDLAGEPPASFNVEWAAPNGVTSELVFAGPFMSRYQSLVDGWDDHGPELRAAILHVEAQLPALKQVNRTELLRKLIDSGSPQEKLAAALIVARIDLSKQLDAPSRAKNRDKTFAETPALKQSLKQAAIEALGEAIRERRHDVDWVNAVPALQTLQHGKLNDKLALEFVDIIEADSLSPESVQPFSLTIGSLPSGGTGDEAGGFGNLFGAAIRGLGLPGMELGTPSGGGEDEYSGTESGVAGAAGFGSGGYPGAAGYGMLGGGAANPPKAVRRVLSRRILLLELLTLANKDNAELKTRLAEVIRRITSQQKPYQGLPLSSNVFTSELADFWQNSATFRGTGPAPADVESNSFAGVMIRVPIVLGIPAKDLKPDGRQSKADAAARPEPLSTGVGTARKPEKGQPQATYQGRTYDDWFDEVRRERSPDELISGLEALVTLGAGKHDDDVAREILAIVTRLNVVAGDGGSNGGLLSATVRYLNRLDPDIVVPLITETVRSANPAIIWYAIQRLMPDLSTFKWNTIDTRTTEPVSHALFQNSDFRDALLSAWPKATSEMRPQFVLAVGLFAAETSPDGELPDTELLKWLADVAGSDDVETRLPLRNNRTSLKLHACRALAQIYPSCPDLPGWTMDGLEPHHMLVGPQWWQQSQDGWIALCLMGQNAVAQTGRLTKWIRDADEEARATIELMWISTPAGNDRKSRGIAVPRRLLMLEVLRTISKRDQLSAESRAILQALQDGVPKFAARALENSRGVERAATEYAYEVETSAVGTLIQIQESTSSSRLDLFDSEQSTLDAAWLVVAHRRCQKLIAEILGESDSSTLPEKQPDPQVPDEKPE